MNPALPAATISILVAGCVRTNGISLIGVVFVCFAASCVVSRWSVRPSATGVCQLVVAGCVILS